MLGPEKMMEYETNKGLKEAQTHGAEAQAGHAEAETGAVQAHTPQIAAIDRANIGQSEAAAGSAWASAGLARTQAGDIQATRGARLGEIGARVRGQEIENILGESTLAPRINEATIRAQAAMREEDQAQAISPDVVGSTRAKLRGEAAAAEWKGPEAAARVALTEKQEQVAGMAKGSAQTKADLDPFIDEATMPGETVPWQRQAANVAPLYAYIKAETGAAGTDAAATASEALDAIASGMRVGVNDKTGEIMLRGKKRMIGKRAAGLLRTRMDQYKAAQNAAATAGVGGE